MASLACGSLPRVVPTAAPSPTSKAHVSTQTSLRLAAAVVPQSARSVNSAPPSSSAACRVATQGSLSGMLGDSSDDEDMGRLLSRTAQDYPLGVVRYETMVVLRPDVTDEERVSFTQRYEEFLIAAGAVEVEMFNRGMQPLAYPIKTKNMGGVLSKYLDGIFLLFMYVTRPESGASLQSKLNKDDDVIRSTTFKLQLKM